jgi:hypothetical protein
MRPANIKLCCICVSVTADRPALRKESAHSNAQRAIINREAAEWLIKIVWIKRSGCLRDCGAADLEI